MHVLSQLAHRRQTRILGSALGFLICLMGYGQTPDPSAAFEVASVKPSPPPRGPRVAFCRGGPGTKDPGVFTCAKSSVASLLAEAFHLEQYQLPSSDVYGGTATYEITAKVPDGATREQLRVMLRNLLIERFKLGYHFEKRQKDIYDLVVAKSGLKMKESSQSVQSGQDGLGKQSATRVVGPTVDAEGYPILAKPKNGMSVEAVVNGLARWTASAVGIKEIVALVSSTLSSPVTDRTGLLGNYDFTLSWATDDDPADDPRGPTVAEAIEKQLGLKLDRKKGSIDVLIIDHLQKIPVEN
jgi:uncharacterized protein (TIGR03435 family)